MTLGNFLKNKKGNRSFSKILIFSSLVLAILIIPNEASAWGESFATYIKWLLSPGQAARDFGFGLIHSFVQEAVFTVLGFLSIGLSIAGAVLNASIHISIVNASAFLSNSPTIIAIWSVIRDFGNIALIFALLYSAILTILRIGSGKKIITSVIMVALLINFSAFFTRFAIDISNKVTLEFYEAIVGQGQKIGAASPGLGEGLVGNFFTSIGANNLDNGLSNVIMYQLRLASILDPGDGASTEEQAFAKTASSTYGLVALLGGSVVIFITFFILITMAVILIIRMFILFLLIATSPLGILSFAFPNLSIGKKWLSILYSNLIFPPVMFLILWLGLFILGTPPEAESLVQTVSKLVSAGSSPTGAAALASFQSIAQVVLQYVLVIGLLIMSIVSAKNAGAMGAAKMEAWSRSMGGTITSALGRNTVGKAAKKFGTKYDAFMSDLRTADKKDLGFGMRQLKKLEGTMIGRATIDKAREGITGIAKSKYGGNYNIYESEETVRKNISREDEKANAVKAERLIKEAKPTLEKYEEAVETINKEYASNDPLRLEKLKQLSVAKNLSAEDIKKDPSKAYVYDKTGMKKIFQNHDGKVNEALGYFDSEIDTADMKELLVAQNKKGILKDKHALSLMRPDTIKAIMEDHDNFSSGERQELREYSRGIFNRSIENNDMGRLQYMNEREVGTMSRRNKENFFLDAAIKAEQGLFKEDTMASSKLLGMMVRSDGMTPARKERMVEILSRWGNALHTSGQLVANKKDPNLLEAVDPNKQSAVEFANIYNFIKKERQLQDFDRIDIKKAVAIDQSATFDRDNDYTKHHL